MFLCDYQSAHNDYILRVACPPAQNLRTCIAIGNSACLRKGTKKSCYLISNGKDANSVTSGLRFVHAKVRAVSVKRTAHVIRSTDSSGKAL